MKTFHLFHIYQLRREDNACDTLPSFYHTLKAQKPDYQNISLLYNTKPCLVLLTTRSTKEDSVMAHKAQYDMQSHKKKKLIIYHQKWNKKNCIIPVRSCRHNKDQKILITWSDLQTMLAYHIKQKYQIRNKELITAIFLPEIHDPDKQEVFFLSKRRRYIAKLSGCTAYPFTAICKIQTRKVSINSI